MQEILSQRPTWAKINLDNLAFNFRSSKNFIGEKLKYMAVVKADGYGHDAVQCARRLEIEGADLFGVAIPEEGTELRQNGIKKPILCLGGFWSGQEKSLLENDLTPVIYQIRQAAALDQFCAAQSVKLNFHIKIDTGMGRIGVRFDEVREFAEKLSTLKNINIDGIMTHFAAADDLKENDFTNLQIKRFKDSVAIFTNKGFTPTYLDLANSPGAVVHKESRENTVRLGGILYGLGKDVLPAEADQPVLKPVMSLYSKIAHLKKVPRGESIGYSRTFRTIRDSIIATVPIGYEDGVPRVLSNRGKVIVNDHYAPVVGRISMDWTIIDVTDIPNVKLEDIVTIIGKDNDLIISAEDLAKQSDTISYEITCGINRRVPKFYVGSK